MTRRQEPYIIVVLDYPDIEPARALVAQLNPQLCRLKVATTMFTRYGPAWIEELVAAGFSVFLDLKFHDIPQQVAGACRSAAALNVWMLTLHTQGGRRMLEAARNAIDQYSGRQKPLLVGVTVLTSMDDEDLIALGQSHSVDTLVPKMAKMAEDAGLDGAVCSAQEAAALRAQCHDDFLLVTPGIRLASDGKQDQKRIMTPEKAIMAGSDYLVIGRSITQASDPLAVLQAITESIAPSTLL